MPVVARPAWCCVLAILLVAACHDRPNAGPAPTAAATSAPTSAPSTVAQATSRPPAWSYKPSAGAQRNGATGLLGRPAPELRIGRWTEGDRKPPSLVASRGKVVVIYAFQGW